MANLHLPDIPTRDHYFTYTIKPANIFKLFSDERSCTICGGEYAQPTPPNGHVGPFQLHDKTADKAHVFCGGCVIKWLETSNTCPTCRLVLFEKDDEPAVVVEMDDEEHDSLAADVELALAWTDMDNDMETLVQLAGLGSRLAQRHAGSPSRYWWHSSGEEPMITLLHNRAETFRYHNYALEIETAAYAGAGYRPQHARPLPLSDEPRDLDVIALIDRLRDAYFSRLFAALGVNNDGIRGALHLTAACHPLATVAYEVLSAAIADMGVRLGSRTTSLVLRKKLAQAVSRDDWLRHLPCEGWYENQTAMPDGMDGYIEDLIREVVMEFTDGTEGM